jgi:predicted membrane protein
MNEYYELARILAYPLGAGGLFYLATVFPKVRPTLYAITFYFLMWTALLFVQMLNTDDYRTIANIVSTPALVIIVLSIWFNIWTTRKE